MDTLEISYEEQRVAEDRAFSMFTHRAHSDDYYQLYLWSHGYHCKDREAARRALARIRNNES